MTRRLRRAWRFGFVLALPVAMASSGCSSSADGSGDVKGVVVVDGQPAAQGAITFVPVDGMSPTSGSRIVDGKYQARVAAGDADVMIRVPRIVGERRLYDTPDSPVQQIMKESLPAKYNNATELRIGVQEGANEFNFDLTSK